jgi:hypothetical protein
VNKYEAVAFIFAAVSTAVGISSVAIAWVKSRTVARPPAVADTARMEERLARIENAVETIALEIERVSEGQRYTTKLLAERAADEAPMRAGRSDAR